MSSFNFKNTAISGCDLKITYENGLYCVRKNSKNKEYNERIVKQAEKQKKFSNLNTFMRVSTPKIFAIDSEGFSMEYIRGKDISEFFKKIDIAKTRSFAKTLIEIIKTEISACNFEEIDASIFNKKFITLEKRVISVLGEDCGKKIKFFFENIPSGKIPTGVCHGDLTFSNILFKNDREVYLIDFLDTFYETPLQDIVKIRQDTKYNWTFAGYNSYNEHLIDHREKIILEYIDREIIKTFSQEEFYKKYYNYFQLMNFIRILPYADNKIEKYVSYKIKKMVNEWT